MSTNTTEDELEHKIARIISSMVGVQGYKMTNGERNEEANYLRNDQRFQQIMEAILSWHQKQLYEAEQRGMRKVLTLKKAIPCPACNDITLIPNDDIGTICVKCKATYPF